MSSNGSTIGKSCWTCRIRRKKCDGFQPVCKACSALNITCHNRLSKPDWMDGGVQQEQMAARIKRDVKENGPRRGERRSTNQEQTNPNTDSHEKATMSVPGIILPLTEVPTVEIGSLFRASPSKAQQNYNEDPFPKDECVMSPVGWSNNVLLMFYLDNVVPFLFPLYRPSLHKDGGRAWILEMVFKSPAIRQAILCQASVFYALTLGTEDLHAVWETVIKHTGDAFAMLRQALQYRLENPIPSTPHCTVRIIAAIMQLQRFEIATLSFENCRTHLTAALDLFQRLLTSEIIDQAAPKARFNAMLQALQRSENGFIAHPTHISSSEQAAFRFTSALLIVDDILASTVLQQSPRLYEYHEGVLGDCDSTDGFMNLENINGCQNWVFAELGKIAVLDAWKQQCKRAGNLDVIELAHRAIPIRDSIQNHLARLSTDPYAIPEPTRAMMDLFTADYLERTLRSVGQVSVVTRVWAHAAMIYLLTVVSGWQSASKDVRYHVDRVLDLLSRQLSPPALIRTLVWPFCVAACLALPEDETRIRGMVDVLRPSGMFGPVHKAMEIIEHVWSTRDSTETDISNRDIAWCLRSQGDFIILV